MEDKREIDLERELLRFICRNFLVEESEVALDESLVEQGVIDSFGLIEIAAFMKKSYGFATEQAEMNVENFGSIQKIAAFIRRKTDGKL